jgi:hypothetical protein
LDDLLLHLLGHGMITSGNNLAWLIIEAKLLPHILTDNLEDLLSLPPRWPMMTGRGATQEINFL